MAIQFKKATKKESKLRLAMSGPAGTGKTYSALSVASNLGSKIAFIDTERGSAAKYAHKFDFDVLELEDFHPYRFIEAIKAAENAGYDVIIIDSLSHEWNGKNGILELHEAAIVKQKTKNSYTAWADVTPLHNDLVNAILQSKCHIIAAMRAKSDYVQEKDDKGHTKIRKVGMASIQREGMDFEFDVMGELDVDHNLVITKTRCDLLDGKVFKKPGKEFSDIVKSWLTDGASSSTLQTSSHTSQSDPFSRIPDLLKTLEQIWEDIGNVPASWDSYREKNLAKKNEKELESLIKQWQETYKQRADAAIETLNRIISELINSGESQDVIEERIATMFEGAKFEELTCNQLNQLIKVLSNKQPNQLEEYNSHKEAA